MEIFVCDSWSGAPVKLCTFEKEDLVDFVEGNPECIYFFAEISTENV